MIGRGGGSPRARQGAALGCVALLALATACSSGDGSASSDTRATTTTTAAPRVSRVAVDLTLTGDRTATVKGTKGTCAVSEEFGGSTYEFAGKDYPSLGPEGSISIRGPIKLQNTGLPPSAKVVVTDAGFVTPDNTPGISISDNQLTVLVNVPLQGGIGGISEDNNIDPLENDLRAQLTGSIRCYLRRSN
jgi:hypothetical protein